MMKKLTTNQKWITGLILLCVLGAALPNTITYLTTYDSISDMLTYHNPQGLLKVAYVRGYYSSGDGGGGTFYPVASIASTNLGTKIKFPGVSYSMARVYSGPINALWFGAKGDGSVDDTTKLQNALDSAKTVVAYGETFATEAIQIPAPSVFYKITAPLTITKSGIRVEGIGHGVLISNVTSGSDVFRVNYGITDGTVITSPTFSNLRLGGVGATSRAIYLNQTTYAKLERVDTVGHTGISLYMESGGTAYLGCVFGDINIRCQPAADVVSITDKHGNGNIFRNIEVTRGTTGVALIDADNVVFIAPHFEDMNRGAINYGIKATAAGFVQSKYSVSVDGAYSEDCFPYFINADNSYAVNVQSSHLTGGYSIAYTNRADGIKLLGGGRMNGVNSFGGSKIEGASEIQIANCMNVYGRSRVLRSAQTTAPFASNVGTNLATKSWLDSEPTFTLAGAQAPTAGYNSGSGGFYGRNSKSLTFATAGTSFTLARASLDNMNVTTAAGDGLYGVIVAKCDVAGQHLGFRVNSENFISFETDTEFNTIFVGDITSNAGTSSFYVCGPELTNSSTVIITIAAMAVGVNATPVIYNTEGPALPFPLVATIKVDTTTTGNVGAGEDDLISYSVPGSTLAANGDMLRAKVSGEFAANGNNKIVKIYFNGTLLFSTGAVAYNGGYWSADVDITRITATTQQAYVSFHANPTLMILGPTITFPTATLTSAAIFKCTGEAIASSNDIVQRYEHISLFKAP